MLKNYMKTAFKVFLRRKFFTFVNLFGICSTLVVLMVAVAIMDAKWGTYPPETLGDRTLRVSFARLARHDDQRTNKTSSAGYGFADRYVRRLETPEKIAVFSGGGTAVVYHGTDKVELSLRHMDGACWEVLQFEFLEGRPFTAQEDAEGSPLAVISEATRDRLFGGDSAVGKALETDSQTYRVVGVVRNVSLFRSVYAEVWVPLGSAAWERQGEDGLVGHLEILLLARTPHDFPRIKAEFRAMLSRVDLGGITTYDRLYSEAETPFEAWARSVSSYSGEESFSEIAKIRLVILLTIGALLFMSLPALNLTNLNLSRILERASEIGVRKAFGASSRVLVGQFVVENLLLTAVGGALGYIVCILVLRSFAWWGWAGSEEFGLSLPVFGWGLALIAVFGLVSGAYPAWRMARLHPAAALRGE